MAELPQIDYLHKRDLSVTEQSTVGATTSQTLRTLPSPSGTTYHVRKFGQQLSVTGCTDIDAPPANLTITVKALDGTTLGSRASGGAFSAGSTVSAQGVYLEVSASGGAGTLAATESITLTGRGALTVNFPTESIADGDTLTLYLSHAGSTYYDSGMIYGGARHTPTGTSDLPYFDISTAYAACSSNDGVQVDDSETYDEELDLDTATTYLFAALGQTPTLTRGIGARTTREVSKQFNNTNAKYFNENGDDSTGDGTWHTPYKTPNAARTAAAASDTIVYGGTGATVDGNVDNGGTVALNGTDDQLEADYGYTPTLLNYIVLGTSVANTCEIRGVKVTGGSTAKIQSTNAEVYDCTVYGVDTGIDVSRDTSIYNCYVYNCVDGIEFFPFNGDSMLVEDCLIDNCTNSGILIEGFGVGSHTLTFNISNNIFTNNTTRGLYIKGNNGGTIVINGNIDNNMFYRNTYGFLLDETGATSITCNASVDNSIVYGNTLIGIYFVSVSKTINYSNFYENTTDYVGVTSASEISGDPKLAKPSSPVLLGLTSDSPCKNADASGIDTGPIFRMIEINASSIVLNGFIVDGQSIYNDGVYIQDTADHTGTTVQWCTFQNLAGICIDLYDNDTDLDAVIANVYFDQCGDGLRLQYGGNTIDECIFYSNYRNGCYINNTTHAFNHCVFVGNDYGLLGSLTSGGVTFKNSITYNNSLYGIYQNGSEIVVTYSCIADLVNSLVDITASTNITDDPLFVNTSTSVDLHLKREARGNIVDSPCVDASDDSDFPDIGAYDELSTVDNDSWKRHKFTLGPKTVNESLDLQERTTHTDTFGNLRNYANSDRRVFPIVFGGDSGMTPTLRNKLRYIQALMPTRENGLKSSECEVRWHPAPTEYYGSGTGTIDASAKTITDSSAEWVENEKKGFWVSVKFYTGTGATLSASGKTLTDTGAFTGLDLTGYYLYYDSLYFYILSNTNDVLTLSDPNGDLSDETGYSYAITKQFKIISNDETVLTLVDDDGELVDGSYAYFVDFVLCRVIAKDFNTRQPSYSFDESHQMFKSGIRLTLQEID
jgi:hypothetical protein